MKNRIPFSLVILDQSISWVFESWFKLLPQRPKKSLGQLRLKLHYTELSIVPSDSYTRLIEVLYFFNKNVYIFLILDFVE